MPEEEEEGEAPLAHSSAVFYDSDCSFNTDNTVSSIRPSTDPSSQETLTNSQNHLNNEGQPNGRTPLGYFYPTTPRTNGVPSSVTPNGTSKWRNNHHPPPSNENPLPVPEYIPSVNPAFQSDANHNQVQPSYPWAQYYLPRPPAGRAPSVASLPYGMDSQTLDDSSVTAHEKTVSRFGCLFFC